MTERYRFRPSYVRLLVVLALEITIMTAGNAGLAWRTSSNAMGLPSATRTEAVEPSYKNSHTNGVLTAVISTVTVFPTTQVGGTNVAGEVTLSAPAPAGGAVVTLSTSSSLAIAPKNVKVYARQSVAAFNIKTKRVVASISVTVSATYGSTANTTLTIVPTAAALSSVTLNPTTVTGGSTSQGTVNLTAAAPTGGATVALTSTNSSVASVPTSLTVPAGSVSASFSVATATVQSISASTITASYAGGFSGSSLTVLPPAAGAQFYVSPNGSPSGNGSISSPWDLQTALNQPSAVQPGSTINLRGGTYKGKFISNLNGQPGNAITVQSYPGEWARLDGYVTTTLNGSINSSTTSLTLVNGSSFKNGDDFTFRDGTTGTEEVVHLNGKSGSTFTSCVRGWNGTAPISHSSGAMMILGGSQVTQNGSYTIWCDVEVTNSGPIRVQALPDDQSAPYGRGEGFFNVGAHNKFINCIIHDVQDGIFNGVAGIGPEVYGCLIFNNGYVAGGTYNGHGLYLQHGNVNYPAYMKENTIFNNSHHGIKGASDSGDTVNIWNEGNICFNNGSWANGDTRNFNLYMNTSDSTADAITVKDNFLWHPIGKNGGNLVLGGEANVGSITVTGNHVMGGGQAVEVDRWSNVTFTGNFVDASAADPGNAQLVQYVLNSGGTTATWNNNTYYNNTSGARGFYYSIGGSALTLAQWRSASGFDAASSQTVGHPTSNIVILRPNSYDNRQANVIVYNWSGGDTATISLPGILSNGDSYSIYAAENFLGSPVVGGTYNGSVSIPLNGSTVAQPIGWSNTIPTMRPAFAVFRVWKGTRPF